MKPSAMTEGKLAFFHPAVQSRVLLPSNRVGVEQTEQTKPVIPTPSHALHTAVPDSRRAPRSVGIALGQPSTWIRDPAGWARVLCEVGQETGLSRRHEGQSLWLCHNMLSFRAICWVRKFTKCILQCGGRLVKITWLELWLLPFDKRQWSV